MQSAVPKGEGGMVAVLGSKIENLENIINENKKRYECYIANDNSEGQIVVSGRLADLEELMKDLKSNNIKNINLGYFSSLFHWYV